MIRLGSGLAKRNMMMAKSMENNPLPLVRYCERPYYFDVTDQYVSEPVGYTQFWPSPATFFWALRPSIGRYDLLHDVWDVIPPIAS